MRWRSFSPGTYTFSESAAMDFKGFPADTLAFLQDLSENNNRDWFQAHKSRYETNCLTPALSFITAMQKPLAKVAPVLLVEPKRVGGSLLRIYKDTRFSKDKTPYKTNIGIQFRHQAGKDVHAPGGYLHISPEECFFGIGMWRPDSATLKQLRGFIDEQPQAWKRGFHNRQFRNNFVIYDDRLASTPRGYPKDHPLIDDLRLKSFLGSAALTPAQIESSQLCQIIVDLTRQARAAMAVLCEAVGQVY